LRKSRAEVKYIKVNQKTDKVIKSLKIKQTKEDFPKNVDHRIPFEDTNFLQASERAFVAECLGQGTTGVRVSEENPVVSLRLLEAIMGKWLAEKDIF
jgi:hypothetical protein